MKTTLTMLTLLCLLCTSCEKYLNPGQSLGGTQSAIGEAGNTFSMSSVEGISNQSAVISELNDGISTIVYSCQVDDPLLLDMARAVTGTSVSGKIATGGGKAKVTDKGIMNVYDEGNLVLVYYDAKVGDEYSLKRGSRTITRSVTAKSDTDDYSWGWLLIKTITIEETGRGIPGVSKIVYQTNHKFGLVAIKVFFEDGSSKSVNVYSTNAD